MIEIALNWIIKYWAVFVSILTSQTFLLIVLSLLKTRRVLTNAKVQAQNHKDRQELLSEIKQMDMRLTDKFDALAGVFQDFAQATLSTPWNKEQKECFEGKQHERNRCLKPQTENSNIEAQSIPKKIKAKIKLKQPGGVA